MRRALLSLALMGALSGAAQGETRDRAAEMLGEAKAELAAAGTPKERLAALGLAARAQEAALKALRSEIRALSESGAALATTEAAERRRLAAVLAALMRLERSPRAAALAHPGGAVSAARAGMTLAAFAPALEVEAARLRVRLDDLAQRRDRREQAAAAARASLSALRETRGEIASILDLNWRTRELPEDLLKRMRAEGAKLAETAKTLAALAAGAPKAAARPGAGFAETRGLPLPVEGRLAAAFTDAKPGATLSAPAYADVYAPTGAEVRFAGPFGDQGHVLILEPESGFLIVFAGLSATVHQAGDVVSPGERLGALGGPPPADEEFLIAATSGLAVRPDETLYMEVWRDGAPQDPAVWFAMDASER